MTNTERVQKWRTANQEKYQVGYKNYYTKNRERILDKAYPNRHAPKQEHIHKRCPWYRHWQSAKQRCDNPKAGSYKYYGGRGIKCHLTKDDCAALWQRDKAWLLKRPSLDKIDSDQHYTLANCRFIELSENCSKGTQDTIRRRQRGVVPSDARNAQP